MTQESSPPEHAPLLSHAAIDIWLAMPATKVYLQSLKEYLYAVEDTPVEQLTNSENADHTSALIHLNMGQKQGLKTAMDYWTLLQWADQIIPEKEEDKEIDDA